MFRFTIRDVLWLTVVVAMGAGWGMELRHRGPENTRLRRDNARLLKELAGAQKQLETALLVMKAKGIDGQSGSISVSRGSAMTSEPSVAEPNP